MRFRKTIEEKMQDISELPLQIIQNFILVKANEDFPEGINNSNIKDYSAKVRLYTELFCKTHFKEPTSHSKGFKLFG